MKHKCIDALIGLAVGDALGVPVEFKSREYLEQWPVTDMIGYGTHNQPPGTWSDDSSLAFCLAESLVTGYDLHDLACRFINWRYNAYWTPHGKVFDVGNTTSLAIHRLKNNTEPTFAGPNDEGSNGNGSLMRILPLAFYLADKTIDERFRIINDISCLTHGHIRSVLACFIYIEYALQVLAGKEKTEAYRLMQQQVNAFLAGSVIHPEEVRKFARILTNDITLLPENAIFSSGYVLHTLEAALWCILTNNTYADTVLQAVNLGEDTDTTGAVAGGLAGIIFGVDQIPQAWVYAFARKEAIVELAGRMEKSLV
jgi:ADP-ribosylglycohydrolase